MKAIAYLFFNGNCKEAIHFYEKVIGGKIQQLSMGSDMPGAKDEHKNLIMHASLQVGESHIFFSDWMAPGKATIGDNVHLSLDMDSVESLEKVFKQLSEGGTVKMA